MLATAQAQQQQSLKNLFALAINIFLSDRVAIVQKKILKDIDKFLPSLTKTQFLLFSDDKKVKALSEQVGNFLKAICTVKLTSLEDVQQFIHKYFELRGVYEQIDPKLKKLLVDNERIIRELDGDFYVLKSQIEKKDNALLAVLRAMLAIEKEKPIAKNFKYEVKGTLYLKIGDKTYYEDVIYNQIELLKNLYIEMHQKIIGDVDEFSAFDQAAELEQNIRMQMDDIAHGTEFEFASKKPETSQESDEDKEQHIAKLKTDYLIKQYNEIIIKRYTFSQIETKDQFITQLPDTQMKSYLYLFILQLFQLKLQLAEKALLFNFIQLEHNNTFSSGDPNNQKRKERFKCCYTESQYDNNKASMNALLATMSDEEKIIYFKKEEEKKAQEKNEEEDKEIKRLKYEVTHGVQKKFSGIESKCLSKIDIIDYHDHFSINDFIANNLTIAVHDIAAGDDNEEEVREVLKECFDEYCRRLDDINNEDQFLMYQFIEHWKQTVEKLIATDLAEPLLIAKKMIDARCNGKPLVGENALEKQIIHWLELAEFEIRDICRPLVQIKQSKKDTKEIHKTQYPQESDSSSKARVVLSS